MMMCAKKEGTQIFSSRVNNEIHMLADEVKKTVDKPDNRRKIATASISKLNIK